MNHLSPSAIRQSTMRHYAANWDLHPTVFVGVPISNGELREVAGRVDDALAEAAARLVAKRQRRRRGKVRKNTRSAS
jgi:hypothetical protein